MLSFNQSTDTYLCMGQKKGQTSVKGPDVEELNTKGCSEGAEVCMGGEVIDPQAPLNSRVLSTMEEQALESEWPGLGSEICLLAV